MNTNDDAAAIAALDTEFQAAVERNDAATGWRYILGQASTRVERTRCSIRISRRNR
jgi:hypothetical protein